MNDTTKKGIVAGGMGLNAAAIIFLYTNFVPRTEYDHLHERHQVHVEKYEVLVLKVAVHEATINIYRDMVGRPYE